jgi:predicted transcriptional regulator
MPRKLPAEPLSDAQLEIMNLVWDAGEVTVAGVWQTLAGRRGVARNTVQTMLVRLEEKGWLKHREEGGAFVYAAAVPREHVQQRSVERMLDTVFRGSAAGLVLTLLQSRGLTKDEAARIREMIREAEGGT